MAATLFVDEETSRVLELAARTSGLETGEYVRRLVGLRPSAAVESPVIPTPSHAASPQTASRNGGKYASMTSGFTPIFTRYRGKKIDAQWEPMTGCVRIESEPLSGARFDSLSAAGMKVVSEINPQRAYTNTNGKTFWRDKETGRPLKEVFVDL